MRVTEGGLQGEQGRGGRCCCCLDDAFIKENLFLAEILSFSFRWNVVVESVAATSTLAAPVVREQTARLRASLQLVPLASAFARTFPKKAY